jgi:hypothetical protein
MDDTTVWILVIAGVVLVAAVIAAWVISRNTQSRRLKQRFGPEYERTLERTDGDRRQTEQILSQRVSRREELELQPLSATTRASYQRRWEQLQAEFVDRPGAAVRGAQSLLDEVMVERGYPVGEEFEDRVDLISVDHPVVAGNYRDAHRLHRETLDADDTPAATEKRRQALVHYRALFADLLDGAADEDGDSRAQGDVADDEGADDDPYNAPDGAETDRPVRRIR